MTYNHLCTKPRSVRTPFSSFQRFESLPPVSSNKASGTNRERDGSEDGINRWMADGGATFHMTLSAQSLGDVHQSSQHEAKIADDTLFDVEASEFVKVVPSNKSRGIGGKA